MNEHDEETFVAVSAILMASVFMQDEAEINKRRKKRKVWVKPWIERRDELGAYNALVCGFTPSERTNYRRFMRMNTETAEEVK